LTHEMHSVAAYEQAAGRGFVPMLAVSRGGFRARVDVHPLADDMLLTKSRTSPFRTFRTERMAARTGRDDLLLFTFYQSGSGRVRQAGQEFALRPGVATFFETRKSWELDMTTSTRGLALRFPRSALGVRDAEISARWMLDFRLPALQLISGYLSHMTDMSDKLTVVQRQDAGLVAVDLIKMALRNGNATVPDETSAAEVILSMMRRHVRENLSDADLSAASLARRHHISVRYAQALFGRVGETPGAYIREQRLIAAQAMLSDPALARRPVADIARKVGIVELRTFERAFIRRYGLTPTQWRRGSTLRP
jgi:AraC-like DNA-binding protein